MKGIDLAVVIVSYNVRQLLRECLRSLLASLNRSANLQAEVWVVDNASSDGSAAMVRDRFPQVRLLVSEENLGFAAGNNLVLRLLGFADRPGADGQRVLSQSFSVLSDGVPRSDGSPRYVWLLNPDTVVLDDAPAQMVAFLDNWPEVGACGAYLRYPDGRFQHAAFRFPGLTQIALDLCPPPGRLSRLLLDSRLNGRYSQRLYDSGQPFPVDFVLGAALMVRGAAIHQVGLLDEGYFMYCEEMDWQRRLRAAGWPVYLVPTARVVHCGGASTAQFRASMFVALWRSRLRYFRRYHGLFFNRLASGLIKLELWMAARRARRLVLPDLAERLAAYAEVGRLASQSTSHSPNQLP